MELHHFLGEQQLHALSFAGLAHSKGGQETEQDITWTNIGIAALMMGVDVGVSCWLGLGLSSGLLIAAARCVVQLTVLGLLLQQIFLTSNPIYIFGITGILGVLAALEVTYWRSQKQFPGMYLGTFAAITGSAVVVGLVGNAYSLNMTPAYTAAKFIPTVGMLFGKCMIGVSIGVGTMMDSLDIHRDRVEAMLCYGATRWEVVQPVVGDAVRAALLPTITNMGITGLISIPGVMTGWVLGGADVQQAARYQQIILFMISASTATSTLAAVLLCAFMLVDNKPRLRLDRLTSAKMPDMHPEDPVLSRSASRLASIRAGCKPISELNMSRNGSLSDTVVSSNGGLDNTKPSENPHHIDIEEAALMLCERVYSPMAPERLKIAEGSNINQKMANWCACCPLRNLKGGRSAASNEVCYQFAGDPTDIVIPHPPQLVCVMPGSHGDTRTNGECSLSVADLKRMKSYQLDHSQDETARLISQRK